MRKTLGVGIAICAIVLSAISANLIFAEEDKILKGG